MSVSSVSGTTQAYVAPLTNYQRASSTLTSSPAAPSSSVVVSISATAQALAADTAPKIMTAQEAIASFNLKTLKGNVTILDNADNISKNLATLDKMAKAKAISEINIREQTQSEKSAFSFILF